MNVITEFLKSPYFSPFLSLAALVFSFVSFRMARRATLYSDIDGKYLELLKLGMANPSFVDPKLTGNYKKNFKGEELLKYELYAFAVWNVVETICDRRKDKKLFKTWKPVIREENKLHREWLNQEENQHKFKKDFWKFIVDNESFPCPECEKTEDASLCQRCDRLKAMSRSEREEMPLMGGADGGARSRAGVTQSTGRRQGRRGEGA